MSQTSIATHADTHNTPGHIAIIPQAGAQPRAITPVIALPAAVAIYSMVIPLIVIDLWTQAYQAIYFSLLGIPKIPRSEYLTFDRWDLSRLNLLQKINCLYCDYANGLVAWLKAVTNQTEIYSCAIKHAGQRKGVEHRSQFYPREQFE